MRGAGKRQTRVPDRYNPSVPYPLTPILPPFHFSLNMSEDGDRTCSI